MLKSHLGPMTLPSQTYGIPGVHMAFTSSWPHLYMCLLYSSNFSQPMRTAVSPTCILKCAGTLDGKHLGSLIVQHSPNRANVLHTWYRLAIMKTCQSMSKQPKKLRKAYKRHPHIVGFASMLNVRIFGIFISPATTSMPSGQYRSFNCTC